MTQNLFFDEDIFDSLIHHHNIILMPQVLLIEYFLDQTVMNIGNYANNLELSAQETGLMKELLWFTANLAADNEKVAFSLLQNNMQKDLLLMVKNYSKNFTWEIWRLFIWNFRVLSSVLKYEERGSSSLNDYLDPFVCLIDFFGLQIFNML